jgi:Zn-dependent protease with chaperone function
MDRKFPTNFVHRIAVGLGLAAFVVLSSEALAQTPVKSGFNVFSPEQDIEIGRQSAAQAERQLPILRDYSVEGYVDRVGRRLAATTPGPKFPYTFKVVNASDINAFALPGGPVYVTRGLIDSVRNEGELAGVMAHEIAHVALRHGTNNASKAYLAQAGIGILGGVLGGGGGGGATGQIIQAVGGLGLNVLFLKFSRTAETQADVLGAQIMARAGYDPMAMATMFQLLRAQSGREPGKTAQFFSDHPNPQNREARVRQEAQLLGAVRRSAPVGGFENVQAQLRRMPRAGTMAQIAQGTAPRGQGQGSSYPSSYPSSGSTGSAGSAVRIEQPSTRFRTYRQRSDFFQIQYPDNWRVSEPSGGYGVTILPPGGAVRASNGQDILVYGVVINHYEPFEGSVGDVWGSRTGPASGRGTLQQATNDLANELARANPHLRAVSGSMKRQTIDNARALSVVLAGRSPVTGADERVTVFTRELPDGHVLYALFVAPAQDYSALSRTFQSMVSSLRVNDQALHEEHAH